MQYQLNAGTEIIGQFMEKAAVFMVWASICSEIQEYHKAQWLVVPWLIFAACYEKHMFLLLQ